MQLLSLVVPYCDRAMSIRMQEQKKLPRKPLFFISILLTLSCISGYLLSKASLIGRTGINLFYKQYKFLKVWWQGALLVFIVLMFLLYFHGLIQKKTSARMSKIIHIILLLVAIAGLYFTFLNFREVLSHRLLGERFHIGAYLFWVSWIMICVFYMVQKKKVTITAV